MYVYHAELKGLRCGVRGDKCSDEASSNVPQTIDEQSTAARQKRRDVGTMTSDDDKRFEESFESKVAEFKQQASEEVLAVEKEIAKLRDPTVHAALLFMSVREKENANRLMKNIYARLDQLEAQLKQIESKIGKTGTRRAEPSAPVMPVPMLAEVDQKIVSYIKGHGPTSAEAIQIEFKYKGRNAACARLSKLATLGKLVKQRAGKVIYYAHPEDQTGRGD